MIVLGLRRKKVPRRSVPIVNELPRQIFVYMSNQKNATTITGNGVSFIVIETP